MSSNSIYSRKTTGLDKNVWWVMLAAIILPAGLLSYRLVAKKECEPVNYVFRSMSADTGNVFIIGETIIFKASSDANDITWDFGDKAATATGQFVDHKYKAIGSYFITATTGLGCENIKKIIIIPPVLDSNKTTSTGREIKGPTLTITGKETFFSTSTKAGTYGWLVLNYPDPPQNGTTAKFSFPGVGKYFVQLTLDHDPAKKYVKEITVREGPHNPPPQQPQQPQPGTPTTKAPTTLFISDETFKALMGLVIDGKKFVSNFDAYLCSGGATPVLINGEQRDFTWACQDLNGKRVREHLAWKRSARITAVHLTRNASNCVTSIEIKWN